LVWVHPFLAGSNVLRYDLVGYVFRQGIGAEAVGITSPELFGFSRSSLLSGQIPYGVMIRLSYDVVNLLLVPLSLRVALGLRNRPWIRILFQIDSFPEFKNYLIEGPPSSIYQSALNLNASFVSSV
jgi:hypothetical protein